MVDQIVVFLQTVEAMAKSRGDITRLTTIDLDPSPATLHGFVALHGIACSVTDGTFTVRPRGRMKECFRNAFNLMLARPDLIYVEGFAPSFIPVLHAWCIDEEGRIFDPTWTESKGDQFLGVPFNRDFVIAMASRSGYYGVIDNIAEGYPLLNADLDESTWKHRMFSSQSS